MANNVEYMKNLLSACNNNIAKYSFYKYLMNRDISKFDFINDRPITSFMEKMTNAGSDKITEFLDHLKDTYSSEISINNHKLQLPSSVLYQEYCKYLIESCDMEKISITAFSLALQDYKNVSKIRQKSGILICIDYTPQLTINLTS